MKKKEKYLCEYHPRTEAKYSCLNCEEYVCEKCFKESGGDCFNCPPPEYHKI